MEVDRQWPTDYRLDGCKRDTGSSPTGRGGRDAGEAFFRSRLSVEDRGQSRARSSTWRQAPLHVPKSLKVSRVLVQKLSAGAWCVDYLAIAQLSTLYLS